MREGGCWCYLASGGERERLPGSVTRRGDLLRERDMCSDGESVGAAEWLRARVLLYGGRLSSLTRYLKSPRLCTVVVRRRPVGDAVSRLGRCSTPDPSWRSSGGGLQPHTTLLHYSTLPTPRRPRPPPPCAPCAGPQCRRLGCPRHAGGSAGYSARWATPHTELVCPASPSG